MTEKDENPSVELDGLGVDIYRGEDGKLVVSITGPGDKDLKGLGTPDIRIWLNEALIYEGGRVGDDLSGGSFPDSLNYKPSEDQG
jgi:hypothetical protein